MLEVSDQGALIEIDQRVRQVLGPDSLPEYTVEPRPSGIPVLFVYDRGSLTGAVTKGDPFGGKDVTRNVKTILSVPLSIDTAIAGIRPPDRLEVWGTVYSEEGPEGKPDPTAISASDAVAAALIEADLRVTARRPLNLFCHGAERETEVSKPIGIESHYELMLMLQNWGFRVNRPRISRCADISAVIETIRWIKEEPGRFPYEVDGALVQVNPISQRAAIEAALGQEGVIAYGFKACPKTVL